MRKLVPLALVCLMTFTGCSDSKTLYPDKGVCYTKQEWRIFGLKVNSTKEPTYSPAYDEFKTCKVDKNG